MSLDTMPYVCSGVKAALTAVVLVCIATPVAPAATRRTLMPSARFTVKVFDKVGISRQMLRDAAAEAKRLFRDAGVESRWLQCSGFEQLEQQDADCFPLMASGEFRIIVLPAAMEPRVRAKASSFGMALFDGDGRPAVYAYVFYGRMQRLLARAPRRNTTAHTTAFLGHVLAHEVGHLLLGSAHSPGGLMAARWDDDALTKMIRGQLAFAAGDVPRLQTGAALHSAH